MFRVFFDTLRYFARLAPVIAAFTKSDLKQIIMIERFRQRRCASATAEFVSKDVRGMNRS